MSGADTMAQKAKRYVDGLPGHRGRDIPPDIYDRIFHAASGITQQMWARMPTPQHLQYLYDNGHHTPDAIHAVYGQQAHPHADGLSVAEYPQYLSAYDVYRRHR